MQGRILIVDAIATNRIVLKVKLVTAFYDVIQATTLADAISLATTQAPDLIISALTLPDGDVGALHGALNDSTFAQFIPIMAIADPISTPKRLAALQTGVRDVLVRPFNETLLLGRVRSLIRGHAETAEWHLHDVPEPGLGFAEAGRGFSGQGHCMLVSTDRSLLQNYAMQLRPALRMKLSLACAPTLMAALRDQKLPNVFVFVLPAATEDAMDMLRIVSTMRSNSATRHLGIVVLQTNADPALAATALDMGADDLMTDGFHAQELSVRLAEVVRRNRMAEHMRRTVRTGLQAAVYDPLTGLHNRRYAMPHLARIADHAKKSGRSFALLLADLDYFKQVNDRFGHAAGDAVLVEVADRLRSCLQKGDIAARIGGEEFLIVMPGTTKFQAQRTALRICQAVSGMPFSIPGTSHTLPITISIGMSINEDGAASMRPDDMLKSADNALYAAKGGGRNQVTLGRPAA